MHLVARLATLTLLLPLAAQGVSQPTTIHIRGQVVFGPFKRPLPNVLVRLLLVDYSLPTMLRTAGQGTRPELLDSTTTDAKGLFTLHTARKGTYAVECQRPGHHFPSGNPNVDPKQFIVVQYRSDPKPFSLRPGEKPPPPAPW